MTTNVRLLGDSQSILSSQTAVAGALTNLRVSVLIVLAVAALDAAGFDAADVVDELEGTVYRVEANGTLSLVPAVVTYALWGGSGTPYVQAVVDLATSGLTAGVYPLVLKTSLAGDVEPNASAAAGTPDIDRDDVGMHAHGGLLVTITAS